MTIDLPLEIQRTLKIYKYKPLKILRKPDGGYVRSWVVILKKQNARGGMRKTISQTKNVKYILKYFWTGSPNAKKRFINEINFLLKRDKMPRKVRHHILPMVKYSIEPPWIIMPYYEGEPLSNFIEDVGLKKGMFTISSFERFLEFMLGISGSFDSKDLRAGGPLFKTGLPRYDYSHVRAEIAHYKKDTADIISEKYWLGLEEFIKKHHQRVFKRHVLSHRDLYPENFIIRAPESKHFKLIDWEYVSKVPVGWDGAFFGNICWRERIWRDRFYALSFSRFKGKSSEYNLSYRYCVALLSLRFLYQLRALDSPTQNGLRKLDVHEYTKFLKKRLRSALSGSLVRPEEPRFLVSGKTIDKILGYYDIGIFKDYEMFYLSKGNTVFKVRTEKSKSEGYKSSSYVFRIYNDTRPLFQVKREITILNYLSSHGIPTYKVIKNKRGKYVSNINLYGKVRRVAVLTYLRGRSPSRHEIDPGVVLEAGRVLNKMHRLGVTHGDYSKRNVLFYKNKVSGVIDLEFGKMHRGKKLCRWDLAKSIALWCMSVALSNINIKDRVECFLEGYWGGGYSKKRLKNIIPLIIKALSKEQTIHKDLYGGYGGEYFGVIKAELEDLL